MNRWTRIGHTLWMPTSSIPTPVSVGVGLSITSGLVALLRGVDLVTLDAPPAAVVVDAQGNAVPTINYAVDYLGHDFLGLMFIIAAVLILASTGLRRIMPLMFAHTVAAGVYIAYAIVLAQGLVEQETFNGLRFVASALAGASYSVLRLVLLFADLRGREYEEDA